MVGDEGLLENVEAGMTAAVDNPVEIEQIRQLKIASADQGMVDANRRHQVILDQAYVAQSVVTRPRGYETDREIEIAGAIAGRISG